MRRMSIVAVALLVLALGAATVDAKKKSHAVKKGTFVGKTNEKDPIGFKVTKSHKVTHYYFEGVHLRCSDGNTVDTPTGDDRFEVPLKFGISKKKRTFKFAVTDGDGTHFQARGKFKVSGNKATGKLHVETFFSSEDGHPTDDGDIDCNSHQLKWTAHRKK